MTDEDHGTHGKAGTHGKIIYSEEIYAIRGAIFDVYRKMGCGFGENIYQECMAKQKSSNHLMIFPVWFGLSVCSVVNLRVIDLNSYVNSRGERRGHVRSRN